MTDRGQGAVERCYREHGARLWRSLMLFAGDSEVASDAVAEAFAQALRRADSIVEVDRWVWRTAFRIASGELKGRRRWVMGVPERTVEMEEPMVDMTRALGRLSPKQRGAVILHHYAGYPTKDVAAILGSTPGAVATHLERGRSRLRRMLEDEDV